MIRIPVAVPGAAYEVLLGPGALDTLPEEIDRACPAAGYTVIADASVAELYGDRVRTRLQATGRPVRILTFPPGEEQKSRTMWETLSDRMLEAGAGRDSAVVALGGGVTGDLAGFVAATYHRGLPYVQIPTTLLAMIDSSIGGKTGVDTPAGKNLVGAFHQPALVVADPTVLRTLPPAHLSAGAAEAVKHGAIADADYFDRIEQRADALIAGDADDLTDLVETSIRIKAGVVATDEREAGRRAILNFGHTVGHAVEAATGYGLLHGDAVSIGMVVEARLGAAMGITTPDTAVRLQDVLERLGLPTAVPGGVSVAELWTAMTRDKKNRSDRVRASLLSSIGSIARTETGNWTFPIERDVMESVLSKPA